MQYGESKLRGFGRRLTETCNFVDVAKLVCLETKRLYDLDQCIVMQHSASGRPVVAVDNLRTADDAHRLRWVSLDHWKHDSMHRALLEQQTPITDEESGADPRTLLLPIIEPVGLIGSIRCGDGEGYTRELQRDLMMMSMQVSVRLVHIGVTATPDTPALRRLTRRQQDIARLAARGYTNPEIGETLAISMNTVKNRLKEVFERLHVGSRIELATTMRAVPPRDETPIGITRDGSLTITRAR
jgi:DNA-binding CsgD family transcriptional regulator